MPFAVKSQKTGHLCGAPFCLLGKSPQTPLCVSLKLAAHRTGAFLLILRNLLLRFLLVKSEHVFGVCLVDHIKKNLLFLGNTYQKNKFFRRQ